MKKRQKIWIVVLLTLLAAAAVFFALFGSGGKDDAPQTGNLIVNGDFALTTDGEPDGWQIGAWVTSAGASYLEAVTLEDGTTAALVENAAANDARFEQTIAVRENVTYRLTARVRAEGCGEGTKGANVSFSGIYGTSRDLHDTNGQWETLTLYGRTGKGQKEITVMARLGGYGAENTGKAWFTDVSLEQVETVPVGETVHGRLDWARRFDHMQQHSGEHICSGLICERFHCDNVGFHMGADIVTIDFNADISWEELLEIEAAANRYIYEDHAIDIQLHRGADAVGKAARTAEVFPRIAADQPRHCQRLYIVRRAVSGRIVHQQHRKALHGLGTQGGQALFEQRQTVVGHDDGRDISCVKHLFSGRICA